MCLHPGPPLRTQASLLYSMVTGHPAIGEAGHSFQGGAVIYIACSSKLHIVPPKYGGNGYFDPPGGADALVFVYVYPKKYECAEFEEAS